MTKQQQLDQIKAFISNINKIIIDNALTLSVELKTADFQTVINRMPSDLWASTTNYPDGKDMYLKFINLPNYKDSLGIVEYAFSVSLRKSLEETA